MALFMKRIHIFTYTHNLVYGFKPIVVDMCLRTLLWSLLFFCTLWNCKKIIRLNRKEKQLHVDLCQHNKQLHVDLCQFNWGVGVDEVEIIQENAWISITGKWNLNCLLQSQCKEHPIPLLLEDTPSLFILTFSILALFLPKAFSWYFQPQSSLPSLELPA